ncbi:hypothetical protein KAT55_09170 [Candidatus Bathyarchaeota archaeon]|nr:hypothetical protein [Candidatus Bathyarchaeota archaeon]
MFTDYALMSPIDSKEPLIGNRDIPAVILGLDPTDAAKCRDKKAGYHV